MEKTNAQVFITGKVQGVGYRYATLRTAKSLGLTGWVRNTFDGGVQAEFEGDKKTVELMIEWCKKGPAHSDVRNVEVLYYNYKNEYNDFIIKG